MAVTYLKVRPLPAIGSLGRLWAVCFHHRAEFEPKGAHWPHLIRMDSEAAAHSYAADIARSHPDYVVLA